MNLYDVAVASKLSGGGGGSSDFTTAEVTIVNNASESTFTNVPTVFEENALGEGSPACIFPILSEVPVGTTVFTVPLYKGSCVWMRGDFGDISMSGDIADLDSMLLITGNGTITLT